MHFLMRIEKMAKNVHILGGGTFSHVRNHLALAAPAFGNTARQLEQECKAQLSSDYTVITHLTKMADPINSNLVTNQDVSDLIDTLIADPETHTIFFNVALCDFDGDIGGMPSGKHQERLHSRGYVPDIRLTAADKIIKRIRAERKDIFLIAFKTTCYVPEDHQYSAGLHLLKENSVNIVVANDTGTRLNMIIVPEEAKYCVTEDREVVIKSLVTMVKLRHDLTFTRSTVISGDSIDWNSDAVPASLRTVVDYCISKGAYKPFRGKTAGHFAVKVDDTTFLTSKRATNFNELDKNGLVKIESTGKDNVVAYGAKPSVGGMSQRIIFSEHTDVDCIVHFHCPVKVDVDHLPLPHREQYPYECGSHECGQNTSDGLVEVWKGIHAVMLDEHGPNIVFNRNINPQRVISFIDTFFDLSQKTGGMVA
jgi:hypothetical protein